MLSIKTSSNSFAGEVLNIQSNTSPMNLTIQGLINDVNNMDLILGRILSLLNIPNVYGRVIMQTFYGVLIGFSVVGCIGLVLTAIFRRIGSRHLMYFSCGGLFLAGWIAFTIAVVFSFVVPIFTWTCYYLDVAVSSSTGFKGKMILLCR